MAGLSDLPEQLGRKDLAAGRKDLKDIRGIRDTKDSRDIRERKELRA